MLTVEPRNELTSNWTLLLISYGHTAESCWYFHWDPNLTTCGRYSRMKWLPKFVALLWRWVLWNSLWKMNTHKKWIPHGPFGFGCYYYEIIYHFVYLFQCFPFWWKPLSNCAGEEVDMKGLRIVFLGIGFQPLSSPKYLLIWWPQKLLWMGWAYILPYCRIWRKLIKFFEKENSWNFHGIFVEMCKKLVKNIDDILKNSNWSNENAKSGPCCICELCELWLTFHLEGENNLSNLKCSGDKIY